MREREQRGRNEKTEDKREGSEIRGESARKREQKKRRK